MHRIGGPPGGLHLLTFWKGKLLQARTDRPFIICIGAQKTGTTWLFRALGQHPDIAAPPVKELHYFDHVHIGNRALVRRMTDVAAQIRSEFPDLVARFKAERTLPEDPDLARRFTFAFGEPSDEWYLSLFPQKGMALDITPAYSALPASGYRHIGEMSSDIRLVFVLRNPFDRILSQLRYRHRPDIREYQGREKHELSNVTDEELLELARSPGVIARSDYATTLRRVWNEIPSERVFHFFYDDLRADPVGFAQQLCGCVGLDPTLLPAPQPQRVNATAQYAFSDHVLNEVRNISEPLVEDLAQLIEIPASWRS
ncbi:MAG: sulfotransferase family protein [Pseudomonadota bacterium]|uniref:sulfotransferase family protein n=1 Tax=Roseovarius salincola TaxID=2978479 RepID=UPI0022A882F3|nr:sulfotransferase [Roseovarius sp. EGI FJ00037]MCZ0814020.1 sulfotransferase [Roseovarius sp. EGI FJ00037]